MKTIHFLVCTIVVLYCTACETPRYVYSASTANTLKLNKKNDAKAAVNFTSTGLLQSVSTNYFKSKGVDVQTAYAITKKVGLKFDFYSKREISQSGISENDLPTNRINYKKNGIEISSGWFNIIKKEEDDNIDVFVGVGKGKFTFIDAMYNKQTKAYDLYNHSTNYIKLFVQPSYNSNINKFLKAGVAFRFSSISYKNVKTNLIDIDDEPLAYIDSKPSFFGDFIVNAELSFKKIKGLSVQAQIGSTHLFTNFKAANNSIELASTKYYYNNKWFTIGAVANFNKLF